MPLPLETANLLLVPCNLEILLTALKGNAALSSLLKVEVPEGWSEFGPAALKYGVERLKEGEEQFGWWTWLPIHLSHNRLIGSCGFKGLPDKDGNVEIGYEIMQDYRNGGLATEMASAMARHAFSFPEVKAVLAHTINDANASARVLQKCGFELIGTLEDKKYGNVFRWEKKRIGVFADE